MTPLLDRLFGLKVVVDKNAEQRVWVFPEDRFIEYEAKDEWWCRKFGFGHQEYRPAAYQVDNTLLIHPTLFAQIPEIQ